MRSESTQFDAIILGAGQAGPPLAVALAKAKTTIMHAMHIHPTVSELISTVLDDLKPLDGT